MIYIKSFLKAFLIAGVLAGAFSFILSSALFNRVNDETIDLGQLDIDPRPTLIYDNQGEVIARFQTERKDITETDEIPDELFDAILSIEDRSFYEHPGIDPVAIIRAGVANLRSGGISQGGSTLTQQLVKNVYLSSDQNIERKIEEAVLAMVIEGEMNDKDEILTNYMNHVYFGNGAYGIRSAVETYYGKTLDEFDQLDRAEKIEKSSLLAGLVQMPTAYSPYTNENGAQSRRNTVLGTMLSDGKIDRDEYEEAASSSLSILDSPEVHQENHIHYGEVVNFILGEVSEEKGLSVDEIRSSGMRIYTSFDRDIYQGIRETFENDDLYPADGSDGTPIEGAASFVNPQNGQIYAFTGGRNAPGYQEYNRAYNSKRQPGSAFKPLIAYGPALEIGGFSHWDQVYDDQSMDFGGGYTVSNWNNTSHGWIGMSNAIEQSWNAAAVWTLSEVGVGAATDFLLDIGIDLREDDGGLSMALGGLETGVSPLQMSDGFQMFANGGNRIKAHMVTRIVDNEDRVVYEPDTEFSEETQVMSEDNANDMHNMLRSAVEKGTGGNANIDELPIAGKTGTTQHDGASGNRDIWFSGITENMSGSVWLGFDNPSPERTVSEGSGAAAAFFADLTRNIHEYLPETEDLTTPDESMPDIDELNAEIIGVTEEFGDNRYVEIDWESVEDDAVFEVFRDGDKISSGMRSGSFIDEEVSYGGSYVYQIIGKDSNSGFTLFESEMISASIPDFSVPGSITFERSRVQENAVVLSWEAVDNADYYYVYLGEEELVETESNHYEIHDLDPGVYEIGVTANNEYGESDISTVSATIEESEREEEGDNGDGAEDGDGADEDERDEDNDEEGDNDENEEKEGDGESQENNESDEEE